MEPALHRPQLTEAGSGNELKNQNREKEFLYFAQFVFLLRSPTRRRSKKPISPPYLDRLLVRGRRERSERGGRSHIILN